jgi:hypothetical protein
MSTALVLTAEETAHRLDVDYRTARRWLERDDTIGANPKGRDLTPEMTEARLIRPGRPAQHV